MRKKRLSLALLLAVCLMAAVLPVPALAADSTGVYVGNTELETDVYYVTDSSVGTISAGGTEDNYNVLLTKDETNSKYVLTLNNATVFTTTGAGINADASSELPLDIVLKGSSTVTTKTSNSGFPAAIWSDRSLVISGDGELYAISDTYGAETGNVGSYGIRVVGGSDLTIAGSTIYAIAGDSETYCYAIACDSGNASITGGTVYAYANYRLENGAIVPTGTSNTDSCAGIFSEANAKSISITGGTVYAYAGASSESGSCGIYSSGNIDIGGTALVTANGGDSIGQSCGVGTLGGDITIGENASVTANSGTSSSSHSYGIGGGSSVTISDSAVVTASGGSAHENSYGVGAISSVTVSGGSLTADGGSAQNGDSCGIGTEKDATVTGGTVSANGGKSENRNSYGMGAEADVSISGFASSVTSNGGDAPNGRSYGIGSNKSITVTDTFVNASGGTMALGSLTRSVTIANNSETDLIVFASNSGEQEAKLDDWTNLSGYTKIRLGALCTVTFDANGGSGTMDSGAECISGDKLTLPDNGFTPLEGKQFKAWSVGGEEYGEGDSVAVTADISVKALWEDITFTVSFDFNSGTGDMEDITVSYGQTFTLPGCGFTAPEGKQFKAWSVGGKEYGEGDSVAVTADISVKALWEDITFTVSFDFNGGTGDMEDITVSYGQTFTLPDCGFISPEGKQFKAWSVGGEEYGEGDSVILTEDIVVNAVWEDVDLKDNLFEEIIFGSELGKISVEAEAADNTVKFDAPDFETAAKVFGEDLCARNYYIDVTGMSTPVNKVLIPTDLTGSVLEAIYGDESNPGSLEIVWPQASVTFRESSVIKMLEETESSCTKLGLRYDVGTELLNSVQKDAVKDMNVVGGLEVFLEDAESGKRISGLDSPTEIKLQISIPDNWDKNELESIFVSESGDTEIQETQLESIDGVDYITLWTDHFSDYLIVYTGDTTTGIGSEPEAPSTGVKGVGIGVYLAAMAAAVIGTAVCAVYIKRRKGK